MILRLHKIFSSMFKGLLEREDPLSFSLRTHLVLLVFAAVLPLLIFSTVMLWQNAQLQRDAIQRETRDTARALSLAVDREVGKARSTLVTLAASPYLESGDLDSFYQISSRAAEERNGSWIVLFARSGKQIINTRRPFGASLPNTFRETREIRTATHEGLPLGSAWTVRKVLETGEPVVSDLFMGIVSKRPSLTITVPVFRNGKVMYALDMGILPENLGVLLREQGLPADWFAVLADRKGMIIARKPDQEKFVGGPLPSRLRTEITQSEEGWGTGYTLEGVAVYEAFTRSKVTGWTAVIGPPQATIDAPANRSIRIGAGFALLFLILALGGALFLGRRISRPILSLASSAEAIQHGEQANLKPSAVREVTELQSAVVAAGETSRQLIRSLAEREKLEDELRHAQKMEAVGTLAGGVAHDFNNILNIIQGYAFILRRHCEDNKEMKESLGIIDDTVQRGSSLVQELLTLARKSSTKLEPVNANVLVAGLVALIRQTFPKTIESRSSLEEHLPSIIADKNQLEQALLNLCVNARDAMPNGGRLNFKTQSVDGETLRPLDDNLQERYVCIEVTDTGTGMDESVRKRIFEPFFTTKDKGQGTGLGLSLVYGIVKNHHGFVDVHSKPLSGTSFRLYFPAASSQRLSPKEPVANVALTTTKSTDAATILVVEDEESMLYALEKILSRRGYKVLKASDGETALEVYQHHKETIDAVLLDVGLPKVTGWDVLLKMKAENPNVKVVIASGYLEPEPRLEIEQAGVKFLYKPYMPDEVVKTLQSLTEERF